MVFSRPGVNTTKRRPGGHTGTPPLGHTAVKGIELRVYHTVSEAEPDAQELAE